MADTQYLTIRHINTATIARLFSKINVTSNGCWLWTGRLHRGGYGATTFKCTAMTTHRLMWAWLVGDLPLGKGNGIPVLDHATCDNRRCCNPAHLALVSQRENIMRSDSISAVNARKTHCKYGHPYSHIVSGGRRCRICIKAAEARNPHRRRDYWRRRRAAQSQDARREQWRAEALKRYREKAEWRAANIESVRARNREYARQWRARNRDKVREYHARHRAKKRANSH